MTCDGLRRIDGLVRQDPKDRISAVASDEIAPLLLHLGSAHEAQHPPTRPAPHDGRYDPHLDQVLDTTIRSVEVVRIDALEFRVPGRATFVMKARIHGRKLCI